jgi:chemotaxis methyl-accepting protein methylase
MPLHKISAELAGICGVMSRAHGLDVSVYDESFLAKALAKRLTVSGAKNAAAYGACLEKNRAEAEAFFASLSISYSEFFRNPLTFSVLEQLVLPALLAETEKAGRKEIRVWSAGCAAGQEAYSIAILLADLKAARGGSLNYRIFATDTSRAELAAASAGLYEAAAVRNVRLEHLGKYFTAAAGAYELNAEIRTRVDFSAYDLLDASLACPPGAIYGDFDLVFCGNLLFYYRPGVRKMILDKLAACLAPKGYLVTGEAEKEIVGKHGGVRPIFPPAPIFQKSG